MILLVIFAIKHKYTEVDLLIPFYLPLGFEVIIEQMYGTIFQINFPIREGCIPHFDSLCISIYQPQDEIQPFCELTCDSGVHLCKIAPILAERKVNKYALNLIHADSH